MNATAEEMAAKAKENRSGVVIGVCIFLMSLATVMVGLRLWCRRQRQATGLDDVTLVITLCCALGCGSSMIAMTHYGFGRHQFTLTQDELISYFHCFWISCLFYTLTLFAIKMTFLIQYYRLMTVSNIRWLCICALGIVGVWGSVQCIGSFFICTPLEANWNPRVKGRCLSSQTTIWRVSGIIHIVTDFVILIMPLPIIWKLNLALPQKFYLSGIFGLGILTVAIAIFRLPWVKPRPDMTWWNVMAASWSLAELVSGITCACLPTFKPLLDITKTWFSPSHGSGSVVLLQENSQEIFTGSSKDASASHREVGSGPLIPPSMETYGTRTSIVAFHGEGGTSSKRKSKLYV